MYIEKNYCATYKQSHLYPFSLFLIVFLFRLQLPAGQSAELSVPSVATPSGIVGGSLSFLTTGLQQTVSQENSSDDDYD